MHFRCAADINMHTVRFILMIWWLQWRGASSIRVEFWENVPGNIRWAADFFFNKMFHLELFSSAMSIRKPYDLMLLGTIRIKYMHHSFTSIWITTERICEWKWRTAILNMALSSLHIVVNGAQHTHTHSTHVDTLKYYNLSENVQLRMLYMHSTYVCLLFF